MTPQEVAKYWQLWVMWRATEGRHLPRAGGLENQHIPTMKVLFTLDGLFNKIVRQQIKDQAAAAATSTDAATGEDKPSAV